VDQVLGEQHAAGLRHGDRRGAEMLLEQPAQLTAADAQPLGELFHTGLALVERAFGDQLHGA
jgi:hypothetical protein